MRILIYGTGAVGAYLGARLHRAGHRVVFLARPAWAEAMSSDGLIVDGEGALRIDPGDVLAELPVGFDLGPDGLVLLTVKAYDCATAAAAIRERIAGAPPVVCLLNGIGNEETLEATLGVGRVVAASLTTAVAAPAPGRIRIERERGLALERLPAALPLAAACNRIGLSTRLYADRGSIKWSKLPTNLVANATSAILGWSAAGSMSHPGIFRIEVEVVREAFRVMRRLGHRPLNLPGVPVRWLATGIFLPPRLSRPLLRRIVARGRGGKRPSFHRDLGRGRSEAPWLHGAVVDGGRRTGVPTPANEMLLDVLMALVEGRADFGEWRDRPEALIEQARRMGVPGFPVSRSVSS